MNSQFPRRQTVVEQTSDYIREQVIAGHWHEKLPSLRALCSGLQVSRNTIQKALAILEAEGVVKRMDRSRTQICQSIQCQKDHDSGQKIGWLDGESMWSLSGLQIRDILHLQISLFERGIAFQLFLNQSAREIFSTNRLEQWIQREGITTWILSGVSVEVQAVFSKCRVPVIILGSAAPKMPLPGIDLSARATSRHAASRLISAGHRRIALLRPRRDSVEDTEREAGFHESIKAADDSVKGSVLRHDGTNPGIESSLRSAYSSITGLIVSRSSEALTAMTYLGCTLGVRIPQFMSLISLNGDIGFQHTSPFISHYRFERNLIIRRIFQMLVQADTSKAEHRIEIAPQFVKGNTISSPPTGMRGKEP